MKLRWGICLAVVACSMCLAVWSSASPAVAGSGLVPVAAAVASMGIHDNAPKYSYVGAKKCKKCHIAQHKSWLKTKMAKAFEALQPGKQVEAKKKYGLDPEKDYTKDESCLKCHTTGFGEEGGYAIPDPADKKAVRRAKLLEAGTCETCHGPGSEYARLFKEIQKSKRKYKVEELHAVGLNKMGKDVCVKCHNDKSPTFKKDQPFDFEKMKAKDTHEHKELKQREG